MNDCAIHGGKDSVNPPKKPERSHMGWKGCTTERKDV